MTASCRLGLLCQKKSSFIALRLAVSLNNTPEGHHRKSEVAVNMLRMGLLTVDQIAQATGLSPDEIEELALNKGH